MSPITIAAILLALGLLTFWWFRRDNHLGFRDWALNPSARKKLSRSMHYRQDREQRRREKAELEARELVTGDYAKFEAFVASIDFKRLSDPKAEVSYSEKAKLRAVMESLLIAPQMKYWEIFTQLCGLPCLWHWQSTALSALKSLKDGDFPFEEFHHRLARLLLHRLHGSGRFSAEDAEICLLVDQALTLTTIHDAPVINASSDTCGAILEGCMKASVSLKPDYLRRVVEAAKTILSSGSLDAEDSARYGAGRNLAYALKLMGRMRMEGLENEARGVLQQHRFDSYSAKMISEAITAVHGIESMDSFIDDKYAHQRSREYPFDQADEPFRMWCAVQTLDAQVRNGGFLQYFANEYGYQLPTAIEAFGRIGLPTVAQILGPIRKVFDAQGAPGDFSLEKLQSLPAESVSILDASDSPYYAASEHALALLDLYLLAQFQPTGQDTSRSSITTPAPG